MSWHEKVLAKNKKEIVSAAIYAIIFALVFLIWQFVSGKSFQWAEISPISMPDLLSRVLYSALVYVTLGAFLYWIKFYQFLHFILVGILGDWKLYKDTKGLIWFSLILAMYFWVVPKFVDLSNAIISFFYNILNLILYLFPPLGISLIVFSIGYIIFKNKHILKKENKELKNRKFTCFTSA